MSKILVLAPSGFGKTSMIGENPQLGIRGLDPKNSYVVSVTSKPLPFAGSAQKFPIIVPATPGQITAEDLKGGRRIVAKTPGEVEAALIALLSTPIKNVVVDDFNYLMQDWYMDNALSNGWDAPKKIGFFMGKIFKAIEYYDQYNKNIIVLAHSEDVVKLDGRIYAKLKTTGKMVDEYVTPEGKFDVVLVGRSRYDSGQKKVIKELVTNEDENYSSPKSPYGMFPDLYIPNDLAVITETVDKFYQGI